MAIFLQATRLVLPCLFIGYGVFANLSLLTGPLPAVELPKDGLLSGALTADLDGLYKKDLPHMGLSFGLIGAARYALLAEAREGAVVGQSNWLFTAEELRAPPSDAQLAIVVQTIAGIRDRLAQAGTDLVVVPLPAKIDIYKNLGPDPAFGAALQALYAEFSTQLVGRGVAVIDARAALVNPTKPVFFATDTHWTPQGAALVAKAIGASGTIPVGDLVYTATPAAAKALTGDLISFVTTPTLAHRIGLGAESVTPMVQTAADDAAGSGADIFGAAATDIVLVGTSYSANTDWGFADALMRELGRDVVSVAEQGLGPLQPMQHFLASPDFRTAPPQVVIWEIPIRYLTDPRLWSTEVQPDFTAEVSASLENPDG